MAFWIISATVFVAFWGIVYLIVRYTEKRAGPPAFPYGENESEALEIIRETEDRKLFLATAIAWDLSSEERAEAVASRLGQFPWDLSDEEQLDELFLDAQEGRLKSALARELAVIIVARARTGSYEKLVSAFLVRSEELIILLYAGAKIEQYYRNEKKMHIVQARLQESFIGQMGPREYLSIARYLNVAA